MLTPVKALIAMNIEFKFHAYLISYNKVSYKTSTVTCVHLQGTGK